MAVIQRLHLSIDAYSVRAAILRGQGIKSAVLKSLIAENIAVMGSNSDRLRVYIPEMKESKKGISASRRIYFVILGLKTALPSVIVQGIPSVSRAVVNEEAAEDKKADKGGAGGKVKSYHLLVEGSGLQDVMGTPG